MTTMDYSKLTSRKLKNLLKGELSDEARAAIENELQARESIKAEAQSEEQSVDEQQGYYAPEEESSELSPEELAAIEAAEADYNKQQVEGRKTLMSLTDEEIESRKAEMQANVRHTCKVMPNGEIEWVDGVIVAVTHDKRSNAVMYAIKLSNGKKIHKAYGAKTVVISEEVVDVPMNERRGPVTNRASRTLEQAEELREGAQKYRGRYALLPAGDKEVKGYVSGIMLDKRSNAVLFAFVLEDGSKKYKAVTAAIDWLDEYKEGLREVKKAQVLNPVQYANEITSKCAKMREQIAKLQERLQALEAENEKALAAAKDWLESDEGKAFAEAPAEAPAAEE